jgi:hypothetical protein
MRSIIAPECFMPLIDKSDGSFGSVEGAWARSVSLSRWRDMALGEKTHVDWVAFHQIPTGLTLRSGAAQD